MPRLPRLKEFRPVACALRGVFVPALVALAAGPAAPGFSML
jgi:hypothetical protein